jgi:hypothetical protein
MPATLEARWQVKRPADARERAVEQLARECSVSIEEAERLLAAATAKIGRLPLGDVRHVQALRGVRDCAEQLRALGSAGSGLFRRLDAEARCAASDIAFSVVKPVGSPLHSAIAHCLLNPPPTTS